jgi:hypothetical protein
MSRKRVVQPSHEEIAILQGQRHECPAHQDELHLHSHVGWGWLAGLSAEVGHPLRLREKGNPIAHQDEFHLRSLLHGVSWG